MSRDCQEACAPADHVCALRIRAALKAERRKLRQVEAAIASGNTARITDVIRMYTVSFAARVAALHHENKRRDWRQKRLPSGGFGEDRRLPPSQILALAEDVRMTEPSAEPVGLKVIMKRSGGVRVVCVFGIEQKSRQRVLRRVLMRLRAKIAACQFLLVGRTAALRHASREAGFRGHRFAAELDVIDQFGSFDEGAVARFLPELPAKSVGANLVPTGMNFDHRKFSYISTEDPTRRTSMPRQGLPQGASTSPVVAEMLMARVLGALPREPLSQVTLVTYADNILVLGPSKASVQLACACLSDAFRRSAVGSLRLKSRGVKSLRRGVEFLGMKITRDRQRNRLTVPPRKCAAFVRRVHSEWQQHRSPERVRACTRSYVAAEGVDPRAEFSAALVAQAVVHQGATIAELRALDRYARRSISDTGGLSLGAVMLDLPTGPTWTAIKRSLREQGVAA